MEVTLTKVYKTDKKKDGTPLISSKGKPYTRLSIQTEEHGTKWLSGFENALTRDWREGDRVKIQVTENGEYLNFDPIKPADEMTERLDALEKRVAILENNASVVDDYPEMPDLE